MKRALWHLVLLIAALAFASGCAQAVPVPKPTVERDANDDAALTFTGRTENELTLSITDLQTMDVVEKTIEHPKKGEETYTGVMLSTLLDQAGPADEATLTFTATDAYSVDVPVSDARACTDCMVAFDGDTLRLIMPSFGSSYWVKEVVSIEAK
jgi:hypothetical protein